jgi:hypothetical protein
LLACPDLEASTEQAVALLLLCESSVLFTLTTLRPDEGLLAVEDGRIIEDAEVTLLHGEGLKVNSYASSQRRMGFPLEPRIRQVRDSSLLATELDDVRACHLTDKRTCATLI